MRRALARWCRRLAIAMGLAGLLLLAAGALAYALTPLPAMAGAALPAPDTRILDRHGALIADLPQAGIRHDVVPFSAFPPVLRAATLAAEDISFYRNPGIDPAAIVRAALLDVRSGRALYGGSTITQQVVRNALLSPAERASRSPWRKLHEGLLALKLTRHLSKDDILALYFNTVGYGHLTYGAEAASQLYFGRPAANLDLAQAALLAGLPRAPSLYDPLRHPDAARRRQLVVLRLMHRHGLITAQQERLAAAEPLRIDSADATTSPAPHWVTYVLGLVADRLGVARVARGGLTIRTTLDLGIQQAAVDAVRRRIAEIATAHQAHDAAVVAIAPQSGQILAMVGSADPANRAIDGAYNVALAPRQPGSAIKPFTYLAALDRWSPGAPNLHLTPASLLDDVPSTFHAPGGALYQPMDYDAHFLGRVPLRVALGSSLNVPAVQTLQRVGIARMLQVAHAAGITTMYRADRYGPALTLGGGDVTLLDLTAAYGTIAAGGMRHAPRAILSVTDAQGHELGDWAPPLTREARSAFGPRSPQLAALMTDILSDDSARLPAFGADSVLVLPGRPAAVKTGTTSDWHDNWTVGYTPDLVVGIW
ncbi:MAG TPA: transglycosylase domain-containing protein, partial [Chloroflexota bacterium]|nr:transglycosylase domain-containing protein [Chloroflexota bacterium]